MSISMRLRGLTFGQQETVLLNGNEIVVVTGANNSGKSAFLRDIYACLVSNHTLNDKYAINTVQIEKDFNEEQLIAEIRRRYPFVFKPNDHLNMFGASIHSGFLQTIARPEGSFAILVQLFAFLAETKNRLLETSPPPIFDRTSENPERPIQRLFANEALERRVSDRFRSAFGVGLVVHRGAGSVIPLYVGERPDWTKENDRTSSEYLEKIEALPKLENQGDGMKAFAAILLHIMTFDRSVLLLDEPEAFLHPPQARIIGRIIAEEQIEGKQIFVATHSSDVMQGMIEARSSNIKILRLSREGDQISRFWLRSNSTERFVNDTLLRTSNALDGLFHRGVVLCEGDRDIVFYREILLSVTTRDADRDFLFINTSGKDRMPDFVEALAELGIDPIVIADIDLIRSDSTLQKLLSAKGRPHHSIQNKSRRIVEAIEQNNFPISVNSLRTGILKKMENLDENRPPSKQVIGAIRGLLSDVSPFAAVKRSGVRGLPSGDCQRLYQEMDEELRKANIWLVPEGELEGFFRKGGNKGKGWMTDVLALDFAKDAALEEARRFVMTVFSVPSASERSLS